MHGQAWKKRGGARIDLVSNGVPQDSSVACSHDCYSRVVTAALYAQHIRGGGSPIVCLPPTRGSLAAGSPPFMQGIAAAGMILQILLSYSR